MAMEDYSKAHKLGKKDYQLRLIRGERPVLAALDDILPPKGSYSEVSLGLVQIPSDQLVGTRNEGRSNAFSGNFMPILGEKTEFADKWASLSSIHVEEGIRDPIQAYEYMNKFYVEEGNKRASVLKYFGAVSIPGYVTRIIPPRTDAVENKIYYEFLDFYELSKVNYIWFTQTGSFKKLQMEVKGAADAKWNDEDRLAFSSMYTRFSAEFQKNGGKKLSVTQGDAFLSFIQLYQYEKLRDLTTVQLQILVKKAWEEFELLKERDDVKLKLDPTAGEKKTLLAPLLDRLLPQSAPKLLKIAFVYSKTPAISSWTYTHELGRLYLEQKFQGELHTVVYENVTDDTIESVLRTAISDGCNLIFTTAPSFVLPSVKAGIEHPEVYILNCSLNTSHRYIRTYYARMHEAKFLMGAIAGAMAENDHIAYIGDYPIYGTIANINAFALGAQMVNPRAKIYLDWSSRKGMDLNAFVDEVKPSIISGRDMMMPEEKMRLYGIYHYDGENRWRLAMPLCHWGKFYEQLIDAILDGNWKYDDDPSSVKAINYWWGMSARVVDIICSKSLPVGITRLVDFLRHTIKHNHFNPFTGIIYSQKGIVQDSLAGTLTPEELVTMDWLANNVVGSIPKKEELTEGAQPVVSQQGVKGAKEKQE